MRRRDRRGAALAWAILLLAAVATAVAACGGAMARRLRVARLGTEAASLADLRESGLAVGRVRARDGAWRGPADVELEGGTVSVRLGCAGGGAVLRVEARAGVTGRILTADGPLDVPRACVDPA